jgi:hypothetical protein
MSRDKSRKVLPRSVHANWVVDDAWLELVAARSLSNESPRFQEAKPSLYVVRFG